MTSPSSLFIAPLQTPDLLCPSPMHLDSLVISTQGYFQISQLKPATLPSLPACMRNPDFSLVAQQKWALAVLTVTQLVLSEVGWEGFTEAGPSAHLID